MLRPLSSLLFIAVLLFGCSESGKPVAAPAETEKPEIDSRFEVVSHKNEGIILTRKIDLYDRNMNVIGSVSNIFGEIVMIDSVSELRFDLKKSGDRCDLFNFVKVSSKKVNGWILGKDIFENTERSKSYKLDGIDFHLTTTKNFGVGVYDEEEDMISGCEGTQSPVVLYNSKHVKSEYIPIEHKEAYIEGYFTLDAHDGWKDEIQTAEFSENILKLSIIREFQEGYADIEVEISLNEKQSKGRVVRFDRRLE